MIVITNSTPLIHLSAINKLFLLKERFGEIFIPPAVYDEVVIQSSEEPGSKEVKDSKWIKSVEVKDRLSIKILNSDLGLGESECIVLAKQLNAELLVIDDRLARLEATSLDINVTGTVGILLYFARQKKLNFPEIFNNLINSGFYLSSQGYKRVINLWKSRASK